MAEGVLFLDCIAERGRDLFRVACERDLEGIVAKWARGTYQTDTSRTSWLKIKNPEGPEMEGRHGFFFAPASIGPRVSPRPTTHPDLTFTVLAAGPTRRGTIALAQLLLQGKKGASRREADGSLPLAS